MLKIASGPIVNSAGLVTRFRTAGDSAACASLIQFEWTVAVTTEAVSAAATNARNVAPTLDRSARYAASPNTAAMIATAQLEIGMACAPSNSTATTCAAASPL